MRKVLPHSKKQFECASQFLPFLKPQKRMTKEPGETELRKRATKISMLEAKGSLELGKEGL